MKKVLTIATLLLLAGVVALAQGKKLKDVQEVSLWAPTGVKADGKLAEWNDSFQAYNKATQLYYTICNDDKNIYLAIKSTDAMNNNKIIAGGLTIAVNTEGKKKTDNTYSITYPVIAPISIKSTQRPAGGAGGATGALGGISSMIGSTMTMPGEPIDLEIVAERRKALIAYKDLKVSGFKDIPDSLISLYNEHGVKTMANYDDQGNYLYEVAIPLKLIGLGTGSTNQLAYNVKLNGLKIPSLPNIDLVGGGGLGGGGADPGGGARTTVVTGVRMNGGGSFAGSRGSRSGGNFDYQEMVNPSDFWGKYILAKK